MSQLKEKQEKLSTIEAKVSILHRVLSMQWHTVAMNGTTCMFLILPIDRRVAGQL